MLNNWNIDPSILQKIFKIIRNNLVGRRDDILSKEVIKLIKLIKLKSKYKILDIGAGPNAVIATKLLLYNNNIIDHVDCYDFYSKKYIFDFNKKNKKIKLHHINNYKKNNSKYDFCLLLDVLHHINLKQELKIKILLNSIFKKSKFLIIKDHMYKNIFQKILLIIMDISGNIKDGVKTIPNYFNKKTLDNFIKYNSLRVVIYKKNVAYHNFFVKKIFSNSLHFLAIYKKQKNYKLKR